MWDLITGPGNIGIIIAALTYTVKVAGGLVAWYKERQDKNIEEIFWDAIVYVASVNGTSLTSVNCSGTIGKKKGDELLDEATQVAIRFAAERGVNLAKKYGNEVGVKAAVQSVFKQVKNTLKR